MHSFSGTRIRSGIFAGLLLGFAGWFGTGCASEGGGWEVEEYEARIPLVVDASGHARVDFPVTAQVDLSAVVDEGSDGPAVRLVEIDDNGGVIDDRVPAQLTHFSEAEAVEAGYRVTLLMEGSTPADSSRSYHLYLDTDGSASTGNHVAGDTSERPVALVAESPHEGQESYQIQTDNATYFYHKRGAGFASLLDSDGRDWISYNPGVGEESESGSGGMYRGIPNSGYPEGYAHPGDTVSHSSIVDEGPVRISILSESNDGKMRARWDIYPRFARLTFLKMRTPYWFLYEGTPGGSLDMESDYLVRPGDGEPIRTPASEEWTGDISGDGTAEWLYVGDSQLERVLYLIHHTDDQGIDSYWPMNEEMTVFGFGRRDLDKFMDHVPSQFTIGLRDAAPYAEMSRDLASIYQSAAVDTGELEHRP